MNEFDRFLHNNRDLLANIKPLTHLEKQEAELERKNGFINKESGVPTFLNESDKELYFAKKNRICPALALCRMAVTKENAKEYSIKINGKKKKFRPKRKEKEQLMEYDKASKIFWNMYLKDSIYPNQFIVDNDNRIAIQELIKYFIQDPSCKLDLNKGICLAGGVGTGKTNLMNQLSLFTQDNNLESFFSVKGMRGIIREVSSGGLKVIDNYLMNDICFDDIAIRQTALKSYGTDINPLDELIQGRYERFVKRNPRPTHFTTNLDFNPNDENNYRTLRSMYDERSLDRIREMCNFIYLGGNSRRK
jgi:DNA replication protein DnaC